jgi:hypothetical protein
MQTLVLKEEEWLHKYQSRHQRKEITREEYYIIMKDQSTNKRQQH